MKYRTRRGGVINITAPTGGLANGDVVVQGAFATGTIAVVIQGAAAGAIATAMTGGGRDDGILLPKETGTGKNIDQGAIVSWIIADKKISKDAPATGKHRAGRCLESATASATHVWVKLFD